jgi:hypothetical protein
VRRVEDVAVIGVDVGERPDEPVQDDDEPGQDKRERDGDDDELHANLLVFNRTIPSPTPEAIVGNLDLRCGSTAGAGTTVRRGRRLYARAAASD